MLEQVRKARMKPLPPTIMGHGVFAVVCMVDHKEENPWDKPIHLHNARSRKLSKSSDTCTWTHPFLVAVKTTRCSEGTAYQNPSLPITTSPLAPVLLLLRLSHRITKSLRLEKISKIT